MTTSPMKTSSRLMALCLVSSCLASGSAARAYADGPILDQLHKIKTVASTVPANGDLNPYGLAVVQRTVGRLQRGHALVSNFNNAANLQGTGSTIVDIAPNGSVQLFAQIDAGTLPGACPGGVGLTTALVVLRTGWVIVGSLPTSDGTSATAQAGCLIVLNSQGIPVETFSGSPINGPWDMTALDRGNQAALFVSNVLNDTVGGQGQPVDKGLVVRIDLSISDDQMPTTTAVTVIASGFPERTDPAALVIGPTGLSLAIGPTCGSPSIKTCDDSGGGQTSQVLYVADTLSNRVAIVPDPIHRGSSAGIGNTLTAGGSLNGPLGLTVARNGDILTVNASDGFITEITPGGMQTAKKLLDMSGGPPPGAGTLFGVLAVRDNKIIFVDDGANTLDLLE